MLSPSDVLGTPYRLVIDGGSDESILIHPPTIKFFEALYATYDVSLSEAIAPPEDLTDETVYIRVLSRTMQMLHIAAYMIDNTLTFDDIEAWCQQDPLVLTRYLQSFSKHLPEDKKSTTKQVIKPKKHSTPKIWIPQ